LIVLALAQQYQMIDASAENIVGPMKIENTLLRGNEISFDLMIGASPYRFTGRVNDNKMEGTAVTPGSQQPIAWRAAKVAAPSK
jgi:hypothetical protein